MPIAANAAALNGISTAGNASAVFGDVLTLLELLLDFVPELVLPELVLPDVVTAAVSFVPVVPV